MSVDTTTTAAAPDAADAAQSAADLTRGASDAADTDTFVPEADIELGDGTQTETPEAGAATALDTGTEVTFTSLELPAPLLGVLAEAGLATAFPIQAATIPDALIGRDVLGRGRTGSGKTLAFGLPTLARLEGLRAKPRRPLALVLVPTRELAMQVEDALRPYARSLHLRIRSVYGGAPMRKQIDGLRYGVELLVATPGRLSDLIERGECELDEVDIAILDEADQMCDMGFMPHVCELMDQVVAGGQRLLFSATLDGAVDEIVKKYMNDPVLHEVDPQAGAVTTMSHHLLLVAPQHKAKVAAQIAGRHAAESGNAAARSIFFVRTQMAVDRVTEQLRERGLPAAGLHGGMTQVARTKTLEDFKEGRTPVLIATDVAARGIHVDGIDLVVHLDPPRDSKDYLHRAGRTARAGQAGVVASLVLPKQRKQAQRLMNDAGVTAEELDAAPLGAGGRWESAGAALAGLTGAREVPEPGDVAVFSLPVRERERTPRSGDRYGRDARPGQGRESRDGYRGGYERRGYEGRGYERRGTDARSGQGFERRDGGRPAFEDRGAAGRGAEGRGGYQGQGQNRGFDRGRDNDRYSRPAGSGGSTPGAAGSTGSTTGNTGGAGSTGSFDRRSSSSGSGSFERRDGAQRYPSREGGRDNWRGASPAARGGEGRGFENRGSAGRGFEGRSFKERGSENRGGFDRNRGTDRPGHTERFARDERRGAVPRQRSDRDRGAQQRSARDGEPR
jgi:superfamily II DNA/RNA helicase